jgi:mannose-6-phosphate isomerase-like protein (cupin superfamily)
MDAPMNTTIDLTAIDLASAAQRLDEIYANVPVANVNDHVVRMSVMHAPYRWHRHPDSDESFLVLEGVLRIEFAGHHVDLKAGELLTVPAGVHHRTLPIGGRSVNLTFERRDARSEDVAAPTNEDD